MAGEIQGSQLAVGTGVPFVTDTTQRTQLEVITYDFAPADFDGSDDLTVYSANAPALQILDAFVVVQTLEAINVELRDTAAGAGSLVSGAMSVAAVGVGSQGNNTPLMSARCIAANSSLFLHASGNPATAVGTLVILARRNVV